MFLFDITCEIEEILTSWVASIVDNIILFVSEHLLFVSNRSASQCGCVAMREPMISLS
jgi:hypothetical protein